MPKIGTNSKDSDPMVVLRRIIDKVKKNPRPRKVDSWKAGTKEETTDRPFEEFTRNGLSYVRFFELEQSEHEKIEKYQKYPRTPNSIDNYGCPLICN